MNDTEGVYRRLDRIEGDIEIKEGELEKKKEKLGRFILATNDLELGGEEVLKYYKGQTRVERGFRFLKDRSFRISEVYLKKRER